MDNQTNPKPTSEQISQSQKAVPSRTLLLIFVLGALAIFFFIIAIYTKPSQKNPQKMAEPVASPTPVVTAILSLQQIQGNKINVLLNSGGVSATAAQIELAYDPAILTNVTISPGPFFAHPIELLNKVDQADGRISYAIGIQPQDNGVNGSGIAAVIAYTPVFPLPTGTTQTNLSFIPKSIVTAQGMSQSVLKTTNNLTIPLVTSSPSAILLK